MLDGCKRIHLDITAKDDFTLRRVEIVPAHKPFRAMAEIQVKNGSAYQTLSKFEINRTNPMLEVGFDKYAPITISVPATTSQDFRLILSEITQTGGIKELILSSMPSVERYPEKTLAKMFQEPLPYWHEYQWPEQPEIDDLSLAIDPASIVDISENLDGDNLTWDAPEGDWTIMRMGMVPTGMDNQPAAPEGKGLEVDKMTRAYLQHHFESFLGKIMERIPAEDRKALKVIVADSYEKGGQNFTDTFLSDFKQKYGYDAAPFLPVYTGNVVMSQDISDRFLWDMRRMVADKLSYEHIGGMREIAHQHGMTLWLENYGHWGFPGEFLQYGGQSDEVAGEFWSEGSLGDIENRAASSCAHIYGKTKVSSESFTCGFHAFSRYPATMKQRGDRFFSEGINNTLLHVYISQYEHPVPPGTNAPFGNEFNRINTWFPQLDVFVDYLKRSNFMLQQGLNVADVAYFIGEDTPKMTGVTDPALPKGYQFDYINAEVIIDRMTVKNGLLTLDHGTQYKILVLPKLKTMRPELLAKIKELVYDGGVVLGPAPERSPSFQNYPTADRQVKAMAAELWGNIADGEKYAKCGKGIIMKDMTMEEALALIDCVPDVDILDNVPVLFGHRDLGKTQVYFLTNQADSPIAFDAAFRTTGLKPELWNPVNGEIRSLESFKQTAGTTTVPLKLEAFESAFIVFREKTARTEDILDMKANYPEPTVIDPNVAPWKVKFETGKVKRGPENEIVMNQLADLALSANENIRYYSGTINYTSDFEMTENAKGNVYADLGKVAVMAKVKVNGQYAGGVWTAPYRIDITNYVKQGRNSLEIEVVNTWVNRLIGDSRLPLSERPTYAFNNPWTPDSPLQKSGLLGPVSIYRIAY